MDTVGQKLFVNGDMSGDLTSEVLDLANLLHLCFHCVWTGTPTGTLFLEASGESSPTTWETINSVALTGTASSQMWIDRNAPYRWARVRYVQSAGTGTLNGNYIAKGNL